MSSTTLSMVFDLCHEYFCNHKIMHRIPILRGVAKFLGKNGIIQNFMLHLELGIQITQGWQFLYYCQNAIEKNKLFSEKFLAFPLNPNPVARAF